MMGYKIWRKDSSGWWPAYDAIFDTREKVEERIAELNATYADKVKYGELSFHPYRDDIKLNKDGSIIDPVLQMNKYKKSRNSYKRF
jgi:aminoglycoside phosphotransferase family enzyme